MSKSTPRLLAFLAPILLVGCAGQPPVAVAPPVAASAAPAPPKPTPPPKKRVTNRKANPDGRVLILEYHKVAPKEARWDRSIKSFRRDLERLYKLGFRPVTLAEYLDDDMKLPPGASPVVFTFDDSHPSQFQLLEDGRIDPNCAVGVMQSFGMKHPDFPTKATFYVLPNMVFGNRKTFAKKLEYLKAWGCEIGSHTMSHKNLKSMTDEQVKAEIGGSIEWLRTHGIEPRTMAFPYGVPPKNEALLKGFTWQGKEYKLDAAVMVGAVPARVASDVKHNRYRLPRVQGIDGALGLHNWLDKYKKGRWEPYVAP